MTTYQTTEYDLDNQYDWTSIQYTITDDVIVATRTTYDAGYEVFGNYTDGVLREEFYVGTTDALGFDNRQIEYNADGQMTSRGTVYADALRVSETFIDGVPTETKLVDGFFGDGVQPWSEVTLSYDADGNIERRDVKYDDGRTIVDFFFQDGVFETRLDLDQKKSWSWIDSTYDDAGNLAGRLIRYDNGIVRQEGFEDGQRFIMAQTDGLYGNTDGVKSWTSIVTTYDANGLAETRETVFDNGIVRNELWEGGVRVSTAQTDVQNAKNWSTITTEYDAGQIALKTTEFDNGDVTVNLYEEGARVQRMRLDGDDSASWVVQVTDYGPDGRTTTTYGPDDMLPDEVLAIFPDLTPPPPEAPGVEYVLDFNDGVRLNDGDTAFDGEFLVDVSQGRYDIQGIVMTKEYGGATTQDDDLEAFNSWGATVGFAKVDGGEFDFSSLSLANASGSDTTYLPEDGWANQVTINGYSDDAIVEQAVIDLTFDHVTHDLDWSGVDRIELVATGGTITNDHVENAGWFSMDDLVFIA